ncbi:hypothetical protein, partial [Xanthomonas campestris]|uniref:hypothetical protein n=1 Tax=Xanthomonas campestris TaxID=339 RepID=UPI002AD3E0EB
RTCFDAPLTETDDLGGARWASPRQLHRAQARSYVTCTAITDGSHSHACNASAKQAKLRRLV